MIYTFYSYKGGVGRSMAMANVAEWFYRQGLRVIVIDWDLEAPGLENFFYDTEEDLNLVRSQLGLIDLLLAYKRIFPRLPAPQIDQKEGAQPSEEMKPRRAETDRWKAGESEREEEAEGANPSDEAARRCEEKSRRLSQEWLKLLREQLPPISDVLYPIRPLETNADGKNTALWLLPAGWRAGDRFPVYAQAVQGFDWSDFYNSYQGEVYFEWMREQLLAENLADVVLIDSRTGVTEMGGVCTRQLADIVVSFCVPNAQNLAGVYTMAKSFGRNEIVAKRKRELDIVVVPTRIDVNEIDSRNAFEKQFRQMLDEFTPTAFASVKSEFWDLLIRYIPKYAYAEELAIGASDSARELEDAYKKLGAHLALLARGRSGLRVRARFARELQREFGNRLPSVFVTSFDDEGESLATRLCERLSEYRITLWPALRELRGRADEWQHVKATLDQVKSLVLIVTPGAMNSELARREYRYARQQGVNVIFVERREMNGAVEPSAGDKTVAETSSVERPRWMPSAYFYDAEQEWEKVAALLQSPLQPTRVPFMTPEMVEGYVERPELTGKLKELLLRDEARAEKASRPARQAADRMTSSADSTAPSEISPNVALWGPSGSGKTATAIAFCYLEKVISYFDDGILWVTLGATPNILGELTKLYAALTGERPPFVDEEEAAKAVADKLQYKNCLLVLDEVWDAQHLSWFTRGINVGARLMTTPDLSLAFNASLITVGEMSDAEAIQLITTQLQATPDLRRNIEALASRLGNWPRALRLANVELRKRAKLDEDYRGAINSLSQDFEQRGVLALDETTGPDNNQTLTMTFEQSLQLTLPVKEDRDRFVQLAFFPADSEITLAEVGDLWGLDEFETEKRLRRLSDLSLLKFDPERKTAALQSVLRSYILNQMPDRDGLNDKLEAAFTHFSPKEQQQARRVLTRLVRLVPPEEDGDETRQRVKLSDLDASLQPLVQALVAAKLVIVEQDKMPASASTVQLANEAFIKGWKRLRDWIAQDREFLLWRQQLKAKIAEWESTNRDPGVLLSGAPLDTATRWLHERPNDLNAAEQLYINESDKEVGKLLQMQRADRRRRYFSVAAVVIFAISIGYYAVHTRQAVELKKKADVERLDESKASALTIAGQEEFNNGKFDAAIQKYGDAIRLKSDYAEAYFNRAEAYNIKRDNDKALADYTRAIQLKPDYAEAYDGRADVYRTLKTADSNEKAIADFSRAIQLKPDYADAYFNRGYAYESTGQLDAAISDYDRSIQLSAGNPDANFFYRRGAAYVARGEKDKAISDLQQTIDLTVDDDLRFSAADTLKKLGYKKTKNQSDASLPPRIFLQYNDPKDAFVVDQIADNLSKAGYQVQRKELRGEQTSGDIRYFYHEDKAAVEKIRTIVLQTLAQQGADLRMQRQTLSALAPNKQSPAPPGADLKMTPLYLGDRYLYVPHGNIEVWMPPLLEAGAPSPAQRSIYSVRQFATKK